jgi:hypothetical protein
MLTYTDYIIGIKFELITRNSTTLILTIQALKENNKRNIGNYKARRKDPNLGNNYDVA